MKHLLIFGLWVIIFTKERSPRQKFTYSKSTRETLNSKDTRTIFCCIYCKVWVHFMPFFIVSAVDFEQVNVCWIPPYQFINAEITYCLNYWQMYKNLGEIDVHKKSVKSKLVVPNKMFSLQVTTFSRREQFFPRYSVSLFHKSSCGHSFLNGYGIFQKSNYSHKLRAYNVFDRYLKGFGLISNSSCSHPFDE